MATWDELIKRQDTQKVYTAHIVLARGLGAAMETYDLRLTTREQDPDKTDVYYDPRIVGVPSVSTEIQEIFWGQSGVGFGSLEIANSDGGLDDLVTGWAWAGRPITVYMGFPELHVTDYRPVFTGCCGYREYDDSTITVPILDRQSLLWRQHMTAGDYSGTVPEIVAECLDEAGVTDIDSAMWAAWAADNAFDAWCRVAADESISTVLDRILAPLACWYSFDRTGAFIIGTLADPVGAADLVIDGDDEAFSFSVEDHAPQVWKVSVEYYATTGDEATTTSVNRQDSDIKDLNVTAESTTKTTVLTDATDATAVRDRWWGLFSVARVRIKTTVSAQASGISVGQKVSISRTRYDAESLGIVIGVEDDYTDAQTTLEVLI